MDQDEKQYKGASVTKPIELKPKKLGWQAAGRADASVGSQHKPSEYNKNSALAEGGSKRSGDVSILPISPQRKRAPKSEIAEQIGHRLASVYNAVLVQPVPERFLDLLSKLESGENPAESHGKSAEEERK